MRCGPCWAEFSLLVFPSSVLTVGGFVELVLSVGFLFLGTNELNACFHHWLSAGS